jgi:hypothetical protein
MKIFVATSETQGERDSDFCFAPEGELVMLGESHDFEDVDGECGCRRSVVGIEGGAATTTMKVVEVEMRREEYIARMVEACIEEGFGGNKVMQAVARKVGAEAEALLFYADKFPVGAVVERRGDQYYRRMKTAAA